MNYSIIFFDISLTAILIYLLYYFFKGTYSATIVQGGLSVILLYIFARLFHLETIRWVFERFFSDVAIIMAILFHQEIRLFFSNLGRRHKRTLIKNDLVYELAQSLLQLSETSTGALIVIEGSISLDEYITSGKVIDAEYSDTLIQTIFYKGSTLHDGSVIIRNNRIYAASVFFPTTFFDHANGTRHVAGISVTTDRDCVALIVSEESGAVSYAKNGILTPISNDVLEEVLRELFEISLQ